MVAAGAAIDRPLHEMTNSQQHRLHPDNNNKLFEGHVLQPSSTPCNVLLSAFESIGRCHTRN